jgi:AraC family transcriptional regulator
MNSTASSNRKRHEQRISKVIGFLYEHLDESLTLEKLSEVACLSPFHFHRAFTASTGVSVIRLVQLLRLRRASSQLVFNQDRTITDIALEAGFANAESFSRAFRKQHGQSPSEFRSNPDWQPWQVRNIHQEPEELSAMKAEIIDFPDTLIAALEYQGPEHQSYTATQQFIKWRQSVGIPPRKGKTLGIHYSDPVNTLPEDYRLDVAVTVEEPVAENPFGVVNKVIPGGRCAVARHLGSRHHVSAADWLYREWFPQSGEALRDYPIFFHYVNVGPGVREADMITDVYLPIK